MAIPQVSPLRRDEPAAYRIRVQGSLDAQWIPAVSGMKVIVTRDVGNCTVTTLTGEVPDQAALAGVLTLLHDLGLPLLSVEPLAGGAGRE